MNSNDFFMEPKTKQYGSHMVMTDVMLPTKIKYLNIDSRYSDEYDTITNANYNITLPERINEVKSMRARCAEIPMSFYNISSQLKNNVLELIHNNVTHTLVVPDGFYDKAELVIAINAELVAAPAPFNQLKYSIIENKSVFKNASGETIYIKFDGALQGCPTLQNVTYNLGKILGFRQTEFTILSLTTLTSTAFVDVNSPRYLFLVINEFTNGNPYSFVTLLQNSEINSSQIIARIAMDYTNYTFCTVLRASDEQGYVVSDTRVYNGPVNLQRMNVQLVNECGIPMDLNGMDLSFCLELTYE